jgi:cell division septation protein DedD
MTRVAVRGIAISLALFGLAACEEGFTLGGGQDGVDADPAAPRAATVPGSQDIERPDIFNATEDALWDGRPSLGGVWIAHPDVTDPERARITNVANGQSIAGALFRRERDTPGPRLQLSSDLAAALGILAGQPTEVRVVAVRREEIVVEEEPPVISDEDIGEESIEGETTDATAAVAGGVAAGAAAATDTKPRGNFFQRLFGRKPAEAADPTGPLDATLDGETAASAAAPDVETQTLDPVTTGAAAAIARAEATDKPEPRPELASIEDDPVPSGLRNPFIQVGLFSVEGNAADANATLREAGIVPTVLQGEQNGAPFWRVVVGPVTTADDQAAILGQVRRLGYGDAFLTDR